MYLSLIIALVVAFLLSIVILKLLSKTFKFLVFLVVFTVVFGIVYFGYDTVKGKVNNLGAKAVDSTISQSACVSESDCAFVVSPSDCNLVANSCNNLRDSSKFFKLNTKVKCFIDSVILNPDVKCSCKKTASGSYCQKI